MPDHVSLDDEPRLDSPEHFHDAGAALADQYPGALSPHQAIKALTWLAQCGYLVSSAEHERAVADLRARLAHAERAADELVAHAEQAANELVARACGMDEK